MTLEAPINRWKETQTFRPPSTPTSKTCRQPDRYRAAHANPVATMNNAG